MRGYVDSLGDPPLVLKGLNGGMLSSSIHIAQLLYQAGESAMTVSQL